MAPIIIGLRSLGGGVAPPEEYVISARVGSGNDGSSLVPEVTYRAYADNDYIYWADLIGRTPNTNLRFTGLTIPRMAAIDYAFIRVWSHFVWGGLTGNPSVVGAEQVDNAPAISVSGSDGGAANHASRMTNIGTTVNWPLPTSATNVNRYDSFDSPDLASVVQEIVDRPGWPDGTGGAIQFFVQSPSNAAQSSGSPAGMQSYDKNHNTGDIPGNYIPYLEIGYTVGGPR